MLTVAALYVATGGCYFNQTPSLVSWCRNKNPGDTRPRIGKRQAAATPPAFRDVLLSIARSAHG